MLVPIWSEMPEKNNAYGREREKTMAKISEEFKVKKDKNIKRKERRKDQDLKNIRSVEDAQEWEEVEKEDKY